MKETRASILLFLSLLLFIFSLVILAFWGYQRYFLTVENTQITGSHLSKMQPVYTRPDSASIIRRDSLENVYAQTISSLGNKLDSSIMYADSLRIPMNAQIEEYARLKKEVVDLLKEKNGNNDLEIAKQKIAELQLRVKDLLGKYDMVEAENKRLVGIIEQLKPPAKTAPVSETASAIVPASIGSDIPEAPKMVKPQKFGFFAVYDLRLSAWTVTDNKEIETFKAFQADKFIGSFIVNNPNPPVTNNIEMMVVITAPDGHVIQKSTWESGTFEMQNGTNKVYSMKLNFDYTKGEPKKLLFSLSSNDFQPGAYTLQIFHNGSQLAKTTRILN